MKKNMGTIDRAIRGILGIILCIIAYTTGIWFLYILGGILIGTSITAICPLYIPLKLDTGKKKD